MRHSDTFRLKHTLSALAAISLLVTAAVSCGDDDNVNGAAGTAADWEETSRRVRCSPPSNPDCVSGKFIVQDDGQFNFENTAKRGTLTQDELARVSSAAAPVARENARQDLVCNPNFTGIPEVATEAVAVTPSGQSSTTVFEFNQNDGRRCIRGDEGAVLNLRSTLEDLMQKYAPAPEDRDGDGDGDRSGYDPCAEKVCGDRCTVCPPDDPTCVETAVLKFCTRDGECQAGQPVCEMPDNGNGGGDNGNGGNGGGANGGNGGGTSI